MFFLNPRSNQTNFIKQKSRNKNRNTWLIISQIYTNANTLSLHDALPISCSSCSSETKPSNQELKPISEKHKQKQEEKIKLNTNRKFSSCSSQIQEATKPISSKPQIQIQIQQPNSISIKSREAKNKSKK